MPFDSQGHYDLVGHYRYPDCTGHKHLASTNNVVICQLCGGHWANHEEGPRVVTLCSEPAPTTWPELGWAEIHLHNWSCRICGMDISRFFDLGQVVHIERCIHKCSDLLRAFNGKNLFPFLSVNSPDT